MSTRPGSAGPRQAATAPARLVPARLPQVKGPGLVATAVWAQGVRGAVGGLERGQGCRHSAPATRSRNSWKACQPEVSSGELNVFHGGGVAGQPNEEYVPAHAATTAGQLAGGGGGEALQSR